MKVFIVIVGFLGLLLPVVELGTKSQNLTKHDAFLSIASQTMETMMRKVPKTVVVAENFHADVIKAINAKMYYRKSKSRPTEKRIRNILLNQFLIIPNDRQANKTSSMVKLAPKNQRSGRSTFFIYNGKQGKQIVGAHSPDSACILGMSQERTAVKAKACRKDVPNMMWDLIPNKFGDFWIKQSGTDLCVAPVRAMSHPNLVQLLKCDRWDPYLIWEISDAYLYY